MSSRPRRVLSVWGSVRRRDTPASDASRRAHHLRSRQLSMTKVLSFGSESEPVLVFTPCDICGSDIFPRCTTREMGSRCLTHAIGPERGSVTTATKLQGGPGATKVGAETLAASRDKCGVTRPTPGHCPRCGGAGSISKPRGVLFVGGLAITKTRTVTCPKCRGRGLEARSRTEQ
jgi:hypothetical protein